MAKERLYIDADEEITMIIDKVTTAKEQIVAVVLPKRATVFQSTVNMKLLKKAAKEVKKNLVIISSEPAIESVAAIAGVHIAKSLSSKPAIPKKKIIATETTISSEDLESSASAAATFTDESRPKSGSKDTKTEKILDSLIDDDTPIELDNTTDPTAGESVETAEKPEKSKPKFKIPDFTSFKLRATLALTAIVLVIAAWVVGFMVLPKATVTIEASTKRVDITTQFTVDVVLSEPNFEKSVLPAERVEVTRQNTATVQTTGQKDDGDRATGTLTLTNCRQGAAGVTIPAGTGFSAEGKTFLTNESVELGPAVYVGNNCISSDFPAFGAVADVGIAANEAGESFNLSAQSYQSPTTGINAFGSNTSGGTTNLVAVVSNEDIQKATEQLAGAATADALAELRDLLETKAMWPLDQTLQESDAATKNSAAVDAEAAEVTVTRTVTYSLLGVEQSHLNELLDSKVKEELTDEAENIRSNGLDTAVLQSLSVDADGRQTLSLQAVAIAGQVFDAESIKQEVAGKKRGDIEKLLESRDGVRGVLIEYSPLWITTTPKSADKITIVINEVE
jgi:hypothetical protein